MPLVAAYGAYKTYKLVGKIVLSIVIVLCVILIITGLTLMRTPAGIWTLGAGIGLAAFTIWYTNLINKPITGGGNNREHYNKLLKNYKPREDLWDLYIKQNK